jgi:hypothetical protein
MNVEDIVRAHADERLATPLAEIERRAGRRPRRRWAYAGAAVATAAAAVVGVGVLRPDPVPVPGVTAPAFDAPEFGRFCAAEVAEEAELAAVPITGLPEVRFRLRDGDSALWVYTGDGIVVTCERDGIVAYKAPAGGWPSDLTPRVLRPEAPLAWVVGRTPPGAERVEAVLPSGRVVAAQLKEGFYAASWTGEWAFPARIVATTADRTYTHENGVTTSRSR